MYHDAKYTKERVKYMHQFELSFNLVYSNQNSNKHIIENRNTSVQDPPSSYTEQNINSLLKHVYELQLIRPDYKIAVLAINEYKIHNTVDNKISILEYELIHKDRNRFGSGLVVYIPQVHSFYEWKDLYHDDLGMISIKICKMCKVDHFL